MTKTTTDPEIAGNLCFTPVILAGGSGTRFWPRSRRANAKQVLALDGDDTMIQQTVSRLAGLASPEDVWVITNQLLRDQIAAQLPGVGRDHILSEPAARNTAPACALAAFLLEKTAPDSVIGIFPSDHVVKNTDRFAEVLRAGIAIAASGDKIVVLGVPPTRPETGYGYIEQGEQVTSSLPTEALPVRRVKRFTEKPGLDRAREFVASGNYAWNSGIFLWSASTLANAIREYRPSIAALLEQIAATFGTEQFSRTFDELYPRCESISIDYAVLEPRSARGEAEAEIYCLPADFEWNDLGSWDALYEHRAAGTTGNSSPEPAGGNVVESGCKIVLDASGNYVFSPGRTVALLGVQDLVVVVTDDALLVTTRERSQDVGKITKALADSDRQDCL